MDRVQRIACFTDFGASGPYVGQMQMVLHDLVPHVPVFPLLSDLPPFRPDLAAYLLPQLARDAPRQSLFLCIVDPGVGGERSALAARVDGNWYVGPDNGLLAIAVRRAAQVDCWRIDWRPKRLSASFHGRDLFSPIAARIAVEGRVPGTPLAPGQLVGSDWPDDCPRVVYSDAYGNLCSGIRAAAVDRRSFIRAGNQMLGFARTFCEVPVGASFWYENAFGLIEFSVNQGRADRTLGLGIGDRVDLNLGD